MSRVAVVSFRLGGTDGVSIEAAKWTWALGQLGHDVTTIAGSGEADVLLPGLAADADNAPTVDELSDVLAPYDLVVVENLASLPLNVAARDVLYEVLAERDALFHHHDLPWQRPHMAHLDGPRDAAHWRHVTINELSRGELLDRGIKATTIYNTFDCSPPLGRRDVARSALDVGEERLVVMPTRAIPRKNVPGALELCEQLRASLWILGPSEDGYDDEFDSILASSTVRVRRMMPEGVTMADAYAGADLVVMPSTWEGFGNPVLESATHRRPLALTPYPVSREITSFGFTFFDIHDVAGIDGFLRSPDESLYESNLEVAREHFNLAGLPAILDDVLTRFCSAGDD